MKWEAEGRKGLLWIAKRKGSKKERLLACRKKQLSSAVRKAFYKSNCFGLQKRPVFQFMQSQPIKKSLFSAQQNFNFPPHPN